jgi:hypothetical protein
MSTSIGPRLLGRRFNLASSAPLEVFFAQACCYTMHPDKFLHTSVLRHSANSFIVAGIRAFTAAEARAARLKGPKRGNGSSTIVYN